MPLALKECVHTVILEKKYDYSHRLFALCESCYWTATILTKIETYHCPVCQSKDVALIPLGSDEKYEYSLAPDHGLEVKFSLLSEKKSNESETNHLHLILSIPRSWF